MTQMSVPTAKLAEDINSDLKTKSIRGSFALLIAQFLKFSLQIITTIILSRLLLPEDFGLFAIVFAVTSFIAIFKDGGLTISTVQAETLSEVQSDTFFWLNTLLGFVLSFICIATTYCVSRIYADERLFYVGLLLSATFIFIGLGSQPLGLLRRKMEFTKLAGIEIFSIISGSVAGIYTAWAGGGFWALAVVSLVFEFTQMIGVFLVADWRPRFRFNIAESRKLLSFGRYMTGFELLGYLNFNFDNLLVAWLWGTISLGFYDKAYQLLLVPLNQLTIPLSRVVHSTLSRLQNETERFQQYFYRYLLLSASIGMPLVALIFGIVDNFIPLLLGEKWLPSAILFKAFAPAAFVMTISPSINWLYVSLGRAKRQFYWHSMITLIWLATLVIALQSSILTVAIAFSIWRIGAFIPTLIFVCHDSPIRWIKVLQTVFLPALAALGALAVLLAGQTYLPEIGGRFGRILRDAVIFGVFYFGIWILMPNGRRLLTENFRLAKSAFKLS